MERPTAAAGMREVEDESSSGAALRLHPEEGGGGRGEGDTESAAIWGSWERKVVVEISRRRDAAGLKTLHACCVRPLLRDSTPIFAVKFPPVASFPENGKL